jgi:hypothetical protein
VLELVSVAWQLLQVHICQALMLHFESISQLGASSESMGCVVDVGVRARVTRV